MNLLTGFSHRSTDDFIVFEEIDLISFPFVLWYLCRGFSIHFFSISPFFENNRLFRIWITKEKLVKLEYNDSDLFGQYYLNNIILPEIEDFFTHEFSKNRSLTAINAMIGSEDGYFSFKKNLSLHLFEYYRMYLFFEKGYRQADGKRDFLFVPGSTYQRIKRLEHVQRKQSSSKNVRIPFAGKLYGIILSLLTRIHSIFIMLAFPFWLFLQIGIPSSGKEVRENYQVGIRICFNDWPLSNKYRRFDFLVDNELITRQNTLLCLEERVTDTYKQYILEKNYHYVEVRKILRNAKLSFLRTIGVKKFLPCYLTCLRNSFSDHLFLIQLCPEVMFKFLEWACFLQKYSIQHYVSYCEHLPTDSVRNIVLEQQGVSTWNYAHSNATNDFFTPAGTPDFIEKWYAYFYYSNFVVWGRKMMRYYQKHPIRIRNYPVLGCLWSELACQIQEKNLVNDTLVHAREKFLKTSPAPPKYLLGVFDVNTGLDSPLGEKDLSEFLTGIFNLLEDNPDIGIILKKKESFKVLSLRIPRVMKYYYQLRDHPRCYLPDERDSDPAETVAAVDLVISAPFTSPTIESLGARKKAVYFDATGKCRNCYFDKFPRFVSHDYDELNSSVKHWLNLPEVEFKIYLDRYVLGELDEYLDGKAITRFRELLSQPSQVQSDHPI
ncbi:polysaccharide biosynthesis PFTS motif protein [Methanoregula formicica]|uniref:Uncharacterized protein n=1 Tax=Methanoregula formicica (strain DSM 22288 / NBRC 105244 / SMSP) TaxID=593750 RepID=L0HG98_METFS|nr:polysaccharide biosynthesis PFTS motif protein [Methanoregula formicica]AGB02343.1 hypothetical protein Metfor_1301 [Methanoregula formicica SMSP]